MVAAVARIKVKSGHEQEFLDVIGELISAVRANEPDTLVYECFKSKTSENEFVMLEVYRSQAALDAHMKTAHFAAIGAKLMPLLDARPEIEFLDRP